MIHGLEIDTTNQNESFYFVVFDLYMKNISLLTLQFSGERTGQVVALVVKGSWTGYG